MKGEVISEKTSDIYFWQRFFFFGKIKFASTEQDCPRLISLNIHESELQTAF